MNKLRLAIVSCGFLGCSKFAPGTIGTFGGVAIAWALSGTEQFLLWLIIACIFVYIIGRSLGDWAEEYAGKKDPGIFVLDEVVGYLITIAWVSGPGYLTLILGFFVFRFFDIVKPTPARQLESMHGGDGMLLDDIVAGFYGFFVVGGARYFFGDSAWWDFGPSVWWPFGGAA